MAEAAAAAGAIGAPLIVLASSRAALLGGLALVAAAMAGLASAAGQCSERRQGSEHRADARRRREQRLDRAALAGARCTGRRVAPLAARDRAGATCRGADPAPDRVGPG